MLNPFTSSALPVWPLPQSRPLVELVFDWNTTLLMLVVIVVTVVALVILLVVIDRISAWRINARYERERKASSLYQERRTGEELDQKRAALLLAELHLAKLRVEAKALELEEEPVPTAQIFRSGGQKRLN